MYDTETMKKAGELALAIRNKVHGYVASQQQKSRRLQETYCWDDCPGEVPQDNHTVCKMPDRCDSMTFTGDGASCISDCKSKMEVMIMCESKMYCVDQGKEGACPTTLTLVQGAADNPGAVACAACKDKSDLLMPVMEMAGFDTMDMDVSKMTMGMITEDNCPLTKAAGECALENRDPCLDPTKSTDGSMLFFTALCECPCGKKLAKFLWDIDSMSFTACKKAMTTGFADPLPGMAEMGPILFSSGLLECMGCSWNAKACTDSFGKWLLDPGMKALMDGLMGMAGKCDEEAPTEAPTPAPTTTAAATDGGSDSVGSNASSMSYLFGCIVAAFAAAQLV
jgi:hypothetical protein